jgi:hypothetical protein
MIRVRLRVHSAEFGELELTQSLFRMWNRNSEFLDEVYRSGAKPFMGEHTHEHADSHSESHSHFHSHGSHSDHSHTTQPTILSPPSPSHSQIPSIPLPPTDKTLSPSESKHQNLLSLMNKHASLQVLAKRDNQMDKVRSTLRSLVRDWTVGVSLIGPYSFTCFLFFSFDFFPSF